MGNVNILVTGKKTTYQIAAEHGTFIHDLKSNEIVNVVLNAIENLLVNQESVRKKKFRLIFVNLLVSFNFLQMLEDKVTALENENLNLRLQLGAGKEAKKAAQQEKLQIQEALKQVIRSLRHVLLLILFR